LRSMILVLSFVLGLLPLVGIGWIFASGMITLFPASATVDGLFMTLILLALSACFLLNAYWEARDQGMLAFLHKNKKETAPAKIATATTATAATAATPSKAPAAKASS
jgi:hypothetical protein